LLASQPVLHYSVLPFYRPTHVLFSARQGKKIN
jgi:hypothetical protein